MSKNTTNGPTLLTKDSIIKVDDRPTEIVEVPEWGGSVKIRALSALQQSEHQAAMMKVETDGKGGISSRMDMTGSDVRLAAMGIVGEDNRPLFSYNDLAQKSAGPIGRLADQIRELSGMNVDRDTAKGNSSASPDDTSTTS